MNVHPELLKAPVRIANSRKIPALAARQICAGRKRLFIGVLAKSNACIKLLGDASQADCAKELSKGQSRCQRAHPELGFRTSLYWERGDARDWYPTDTVFG
jgi:hypothetical protein